MFKPQVRSNFAALFRQYRLKSQIETLTEFGDLLAEEGYIYENSLFTRWQKGERIPKDRRLLLKMIEVFAKKGGIKEVYEANRFLESVNQRDLNENEFSQISDYFNHGKETLPESLEIFVDREDVIAEVTFQLISKKKALLYGPPGVGKTALGIHIGHLLKNKFFDGVFWLRVDLKSPEDIVDELLEFLGYDLKTIPNIDHKIRQLAKISKTKDFLVIFDNMDAKITSSPIIRKLLNLSTASLVTSIQPLFNNQNITQTKIKPFTSEEFIELSAIVLGKPYVAQNRKNLEWIGTQLGYLPISSVIVLKQIFAKPLDIQRYKDQIKKSIISLRSMVYDDKTLYLSINLCFEELSKEFQKILISCAIFEGSDFDVKIIAAINRLSLKETQKVIQRLFDNSFIELSVRKRYRLNPTMRIYLQEKLPGVELYLKLVSFYIDRNDRKKQIYVGDKIPYSEISSEIDNIVGLIKRCYSLGLYNEVTLLWPCINKFLWLSGKWNLILYLDSIIQDAFQLSNNLKGLSYYYVDDLSRVYYFQNQMQKAIDHIEKASEIAKSQDNALLLGIIEQRSGIVFSVNGDFEKAKSSFDKAIKALQSSEEKLEYIKSILYMGNLFFKMNALDSAAIYLKKSYLLSKRSKIYDTLAMSCVYLGEFYLKINDYRKAESYFRQGLMVEKNLRRKLGLAHAYYGLAKIAQIKGQRDLGVRLINIAIQYYQDLGIKEKIKEAKVDKVQLLIHIPRNKILI